MGNHLIVVRLGLAHSERRRGYCRDLLKLVLRHATEEESVALLLHLESAAGRMQESRYLPGLNAAAYELHQRYCLKSEDA